jgi:molybdenum cofactor cytidylyltransferase
MPVSDRCRVCAVVLAAGSSTRMGRNKLTLELGGESLVRRVVRRVTEAGLDRVLVVLGHEADRVRAELAGLPCLALVNPDHAKGVGSSLRFGVSRAGAEAHAILLVLADMPFVTTEMIAAVAARYRATRARLVVSRYGQVNAPPFLYDHSLFAELLLLPGARCDRQVVRRHRAEATVLDWPERAARDIDRAADYDRARAEVAGT